MFKKISVCFYSLVCLTQYATAAQLTPLQINAAESMAASFGDAHQKFLKSTAVFSILPTNRALESVKDYLLIENGELTGEQKQIVRYCESLLSLKEEADLIKTSSKEAFRNFREIFNQSENKDFDGAKQFVPLVQHVEILHEQFTDYIPRLFAFLNKEGNDLAFYHIQLIFQHMLMGKRYPER